MLSSRTLCITMMLSLVYTGCAKKGETPEPESAESVAEPPATAAPMESPQASRPLGQPTWEQVPGPTTPAAPPTETAAAPAALTDEQIVRITETVNEGEIEQAKLAQKKAKNPRVKKFAANMISQHTKSKKKSANLAKEAQLTVADSPVATDLESKTNQHLETLKAADRADFDRTYTDAQIAQHQEVLELLNKQLIPNASHPDLKAQLEEERGMVETHLLEAREIQSALMSATGTTSTPTMDTPARTGTTTPAPMNKGMPERDMPPKNPSPAP